MGASCRASSRVSASPPADPRPSGRQDCSYSARGRDRQPMASLADTQFAAGRAAAGSMSSGVRSGDRSIGAVSADALLPCATVARCRASSEPSRSPLSPTHKTGRSIIWRVPVRIDDAGETRELLHLAENQHAAEICLHAHRYPSAVMEEVTADEAADADVEGRTA